jgi:hypothetical protein
VGIRDAIQSRQSAVIAVAVLVIVGAGIAIFVQARNAGGLSGSGTYFTTDDGATVFVASNTNLPPFDRDGKPAVQAHMFECGGKRVVGYLSRYTADALKALEVAKSYRGTGKPPPNVGELASIGTTGLEVKRPGDTQWVSQADAMRATRIRVFRCPDGSTPPEVYP